MFTRVLPVFLLLGLVFSGCSKPLEGEGDYEGAIFNESSYKLKVDCPYDDGKAYKLEPGQGMQWFGTPGHGPNAVWLRLEDGVYTFRAYYASGGKLYASGQMRINSVHNDVYYQEQEFDWVVVFEDGYWGGSVWGIP